MSEMATAMHSGTGSSEARPASKETGLGAVLVRTGRTLYHEIVRVALYSLLSSIPLVPLFFFLPTPLAIALLPALYAPLVYGVVAVFRRRADGETWGAKELLVETVRGFGSAFVFGLLLTVLGVIVATSWWYYGGLEGWLPLAMAVFQTYFVAMAVTSQFYTLALVARGRGIFRAIGESALLFFKHPAYTIGAVLQLFAVTAALSVTVVGFAVLWAGTTGLYVNGATENVLGSDEDGDAKERAA
ncbi:hypothetical protein MO973_01125 [Paenibacillus sp. TRM 82003]|nr:hypothetical protein [Paenibacillus sp. TRM 82003]